jgi:tRNA A-37 threonylcarbamoyl transferase component Bud32
MVDAARYRVLRKIASGGMAEIFLAVQRGVEGFQKQVVLKRILPSLAAEPSFVRMLLDEAHIASTLSHGNLVQVLDLRHSGAEYFLVLEFVDGWSLEQVRRRAQKAKLKLPLPLALGIVSALCRALAYVHTRTRDGQPLGIVHRDVTPQNVLLSAEGEVKLADFGIAKAVGKREKSATGIIKGKFAYMSPEQAAGEELDHRSDLFSVGTVLYLLTTGRKPFDGATDLDVIMQVRKGRYEKPSAFVRDFNPDVERLIARALRVNRNTRWQTAQQMGDRVDAILNKLGQPGGPTALKRWLESLTARDGIRSAAHEAGETLDPQDAGAAAGVTRDLDLEPVTIVEVADAPAAAPPRSAGGATAPTRAVHAEPTAAAPARAARLAAMTRVPPGALAAPAPGPAPAAGGFGRWARRMAIRSLVTLALLGGAGYVASPYLPLWLKQAANQWVQRGLRHLPDF